MTIWSFLPHFCSVTLPGKSDFCTTKDSDNSNDKIELLFSKIGAIVTYSNSFGKTTPLLKAVENLAVEKLAVEKLAVGQKSC